MTQYIDKDAVVEVYTQGYHPDEIDDFLQKEFGIIDGSSAAQKCLEYNVARKVAEKLWKYKGPVSKNLEEAAEKHALQCHSKKASVATLAASIYDFKAGANWQKKRVINKACEFITSSIWEYLTITHYGGEEGVKIDTDRFEKDFRKVMED